MSDAQINRSVLPFPAELRLKIYRNLVKKTYLALGTTPEHYLSATDGDRKPLAPSAGLVILRVSKATSAEALKLLYEESIFLFKLDFKTDFICDGPPQKAVALMKNVSFDISARYSAERYEERVMSINEGRRPSDELMSQRTMELFTGTACFRNIMRIKYKNRDTDTHHFCPASFDIATQNLGGFRKLEVEFESPLFPESDESMSDSEHAQAVSHLQSECDRYKDEMLTSYFDPVYGPAVQGAVRGESDYTCYLEFHPRQYLASNLIVKAAMMLEEGARLVAGERAVASLPEVAEMLKLVVKFQADVLKEHAVERVSRI